MTPRLERHSPYGMDRWTLLRFVQETRHLKPTQERDIKAKSKTKPLFPDMEDIGPQTMLRVDYRITNDEFDRQCNEYIPDDKSIPSEGPIFDASQSRTPRDGEQQIDFGQSRRRFAISALPIFTSADATGPDGGSSVVAVLRPVR